MRLTALRKTDGGVRHRHKRRLSRAEDARQTVGLTVYDRSCNQPLSFTE